MCNSSSRVKEFRNTNVCRHQKQIIFQPSVCHTDTHYYFTRIHTHNTRNKSLFHHNTGTLFQVTLLTSLYQCASVTE